MQPIGMLNNPKTQWVQGSQNTLELWVVDAVLVTEGVLEAEGPAEQEGPCVKAPRRR